MSALSRDRVESQNLHDVVARSSDFRVKIYLPSGVEIGVPAIRRSSEEGLSFPSSMQVDITLGMIAWAKVMLPSGIQGGAYEYLPHAPIGLIHSNGYLAQGADCLGMYGDKLTAVMSEAAPVFEDVALVDLDGVFTPTTPSPPTLWDDEL